jgi:hypothetical protein
MNLKGGGRSAGGARERLRKKLPGALRKPEIFSHIFTMLLRSVAATLPLLLSEEPRLHNGFVRPQELEARR